MTTQHSPSASASALHASSPSNCVSLHFGAFRRFWLALPTLHPHGPIRLCWDSFIMVALIYTAIEIPLSIAFDQELELSFETTWGILAFSVDMLLLLDIALNFR